MKDASQYKITFPYGATTPPYSPTHKHLGDDRAMPVGTPIIVNGEIIGLSGNSGKSTGAHEHTQEVKYGVVVKPESGGYDVPKPVVCTETGKKLDIGNFIRYRDGDGRIWSKFHLSEVKIKVGDIIGGSMTPLVNEGDAVNVFTALGYPPNANDKAAAINKDWKQWIYNDVITHKSLPIAPRPWREGIIVAYQKYLGRDPSEQQIKDQLGQKSMYNVLDSIGGEVEAQRVAMQKKIEELENAEYIKVSDLYTKKS